MLTRPLSRYSTLKPGYSGTGVCRQCKTPFTCLPSRMRDPRRGSFCSRECWQLWWKTKYVILDCLNCGHRFQRRANTNKYQKQTRGDRRSFCSKKCFAAHNRTPGNPLRREWPFKARYPRGTITWRELSHQVCIEASGRCELQHCGATHPKLGAHHLVPMVLARRLGNPNERLNLIAVCPRCHTPATNAERYLAKGDMLTYRARLVTAGYPMERVDAALRHFGLMRAA